MKRFWVIISVFFACIFYVQAKNYVVCVGIADYPGKDMDLRLSATDAITMKEIYDKNGNADVLVYTNDNARVNTNGSERVVFKSIFN